MKEIRYDIRLFDWNKSDNSFYANASDLWEMTGYYNYSLPNNKKQFFIYNPKTEGFRRFRFVNEFKRLASWDEDEGMYCHETMMEFISEDNILCRIFVYDDTK